MTVEFNYQVGMIQADYDATRRELGELKKELKEKEKDIEDLKRNLKV